MTHPSTVSAGAPRRPASGLTLVEMLIALALGLVTVLTAARLLLLASSAHATQTELGAIDDGGRYALELIGRAVHQAGHVDPAMLLAPQTPWAAIPAAVAGLDDRTLAHSSAALDDPLTNAVNGSDVLALRFTGDGAMTGCAGAPVASGEQGWSIFYVARNADGEAELRCKYRGASSWASDALVGGVDGFQVLYGLDTNDPPDGVANRYVNADAILAADAAFPVTGDAGASRWRRVVSVRVGLLLHGGRPTRALAGATTFELLGQGASGPTDPGSLLDEAAMPGDLRRRERRLFAATFAVVQAAAPGGSPSAPAPASPPEPAPEPSPAPAGSP